MSPFVPFDADTLNGLAAAFRARSKAITYHAAEWTVTRDDETQLERLNIDADGHHGKLRLSVWTDGVLWFRLCRGRAKNGWEFMLSFHGDRKDLDAATIVEQFIDSMTSDEILAIWHNVSPVVERSESSA